MTSAEETSKINYLISCGLSVFCRVAVNCFYMISGFFIREKDEDITTRYIVNSIFKQYKKIWRYSVLVFAVAVAVQAEKISSNNVLQAFFSGYVKYVVVCYGISATNMYKTICWKDASWIKR